ncbi:MAG: MFS transporter [Actinomycetota bacterium]|nr:MFS transporter [Actinomycetota bacterium]
MALTETAPTQAPPEPGGTPRWMGRPIVLLLACLIVLTIFGFSFIQDPSRSAQTRDPAWYTWRSGIIVEGDPGSIVTEWGPFSMFSGGYRVSVPLAGAILQSVAGIHRYSFSAFMMIGIPLLTGLALAAFAYRAYPDPLLYLLTLFASAAFFLTTPYVGYLDNITVLYILALLLAFYGHARTSWGARSAVFLFGFVAAFTHPTTCVIFGLVLMAGFGLHLLTSRFNIGKVMDRDAPALTAAGLGIIFGLSLWLVGIWGPKGSLADAALPPPYTQAFFLNRLGGWVTSLVPIVTFPLILLAIGWIIWRSRKDRKPVDAYGQLSILWLLPLLGIFGWLAGKAYPYYRFMNATAAIMALTGLGAWIVARWFLRKGSSQPIIGVVGVALVFASIGYVFYTGFHASQWSSQDNQWINQDTRVALVAARTVVEYESADHPIVFLNNYKDQPVAYGWAKTYMNIGRTGLPGTAEARSFGYFGDAQQFLADQPTQLTDPTYNKISRGFYALMKQGEARYTGDPIVFVLRPFNAGTDNEKLLDPGAPSYMMPLGPNVAVLTGPGLATPSPASIQAARSAEQTETAIITNHPSAWANPLHTLRVLFGLAILLVVPGLISAPWFEVKGFPDKLALIPGLSIALDIVAGIFVVAVTRGPFGEIEGWITVGVATLIAVGLRLLARRREAGKAKAAAAINRSINAAFSLFSNKDFSFLMAAQYLAVAGDGIVQGSLAKAIAFGGKAGFSLEDAPSARYILGLVVLLYLPYTFISPLAGVLIDRFDRRKLLIASNAFRAVMIALVAVGGVDRLPDAVLIGALLLTLACTRLLLAIKSAGLPEVLPRKDLLQGNALSQAGSAIFQLLGAAVAVIGTKALPVAIPVLLGAGVYAVCSIVAKRISHLESERRTTRLSDEIKRVFRGVIEGLREVRKRPAASLGLFSFLALRMELVSFVGLVFALEARNILGGSASKTAVYVAGATAALGAAIGFVVAQRLKNRRPPEQLLVFAMVVAGIGVIAFGGVTSVLGFSALAFVAAFGFFVGKISADTIMQHALPDNFRGRGFSLFDVAYNVAWIVPALILVAVWSPDRVRLILMASGVVFLGVAAVVWAASRRMADVLHVPEAEESQASLEPRP